MKSKTLVNRLIKRRLHVYDSVSSSLRKNGIIVDWMFHSLFHELCDDLQSEMRPL